MLIYESFSSSCTEPTLFVEKDLFHGYEIHVLKEPQGPLERTSQSD